MIMTLWAAGGGMILYLAALQQVPTPLYEAASIDGAGPFYRLIHITLPMTSPVILFTFITGLIASFQIFTAGLVITNGGPRQRVTVLHPLLVRHRLAKLPDRLRGSLGLGPRDHPLGADADHLPRRPAMGVLQLREQVSGVPPYVNAAGD